MAVLAAASLPDLANATAVDFGTGPWGFACVFPKLREAKKCIGFDVSLKALEISAGLEIGIGDKLTYMTSDGETIPLDDDSVDIFWAGEVIEHVREPRRFMQEIARVCRDGARVLLSTPNRDAVYFLARGEDYAIGPEHIALMNYAELSDVVQRFLDPVTIHGYETSLYPDLDAAITCERAAQVIQERAYVHPQSASGFIVEGTVSKALYRTNQRSWTLDERLWSDTTSALDCEQLVLFGGVAGALLGPVKPFDVRIIGNRIVLLFWAHDWSGIARIEIGGETREVDLYSLHGGFRRVVIDQPNIGPHRVRISRTGRKGDKSISDQVIFYKSMGYSVK